MCLAALAIILFLIGLFKYRFPYFVKDVLYNFRITRISWRMGQVLNKRPLYTILDRFLEATKKHPNKTFTVFEEKTLSYSDADKQSNKVGRSLWKHARVTEGDTVALFLGNEPSYLLLWLGLAKIGCVAALLNYNVRSKSLLHCFSCCGANVLIVAAGREAPSANSGIRTNVGTVVWRRHNNSWVFNLGSAMVWMRTHYIAYFS